MSRYFALTHVNPDFAAWVRDADDLIARLLWRELLRSYGE